MSRVGIPFAIGAALLGLSALAGCGSSPQARPPGEAGVATGGGARLAVVLPRRGELALVDPRRGVVARVAVGASPWGVAVAGGRAYVSAARHVAVVDLRRRRLIARVAYRAPAAAVDYGEYRAGGMGVAVAPGGRRVYVGVHTAGGGRGRLEVLDTRRLRIVGSARVGVRPFDVLAGRDGRTAFSVDHDSYGVTVVDGATARTRFVPVAPLGRGAFDKLNYGAIDTRGRLLLPINGQVLAVVQPRTGRVTRRRMRARVHQAGVALSGRRLLTIGAESLSGGSPNLSVFDLTTGRERIVALRRPHEDIAVADDTAYLSGGYTRGGWAGVSAVALGSGRVREIPLDDEPLGIAALPEAAARTAPSPAGRSESASAAAPRKARRSIRILRPADGRRARPALLGGPAAALFVISGSRCRPAAPPA